MLEFKVFTLKKSDEDIKFEHHCCIDEVFEFKYGVSDGFDNMVESEISVFKEIKNRIKDVDYEEYTEEEYNEIFSIIQMIRRNTDLNKAIFKFRETKEFKKLVHEKNLKIGKNYIHFYEDYYDYAPYSSYEEKYLCPMPDYIKKVFTRIIDKYKCRYIDSILTDLFFCGMFPLHQLKQSQFDISYYPEISSITIEIKGKTSIHSIKKFIDKNKQQIEKVLNNGKYKYDKPKIIKERDILIKDYSDEFILKEYEIEEKMKDKFKKVKHNRKTKNDIKNLISSIFSPKNN